MESNVFVRVHRNVEGHDRTVELHLPYDRDTLSRDVGIACAAAAATASGLVDDTQRPRVLSLLQELCGRSHELYDQSKPIFNEYAPALSYAIAALASGPQATAQPRLGATAPSQPIRIAADGSHLPASGTSTDHVAVLFPDTGLMFAAASIGDEPGTQQECVERCKELRLLGFEDWQLASRAEAVSLIDDTRRNPAIDIRLFPRVLPKWHWTRTELAPDPDDEAAAAASSAFAWLVHFSYGVVYNDRRDLRGFGLAVCRAGQ